MVRLPDGAARARADAERELAEATAETTRLDAELGARAEERGKLDVPPALAAESPAIDRLPTAIAGARRRRPPTCRACGASSSAPSSPRGRCCGAWVRARWPTSGATPATAASRSTGSSRCASTARRQARIRKLAAERALAEQRRAQAEAALGARRAKLDAIALRRRELPAAGDAARLRCAAQAAARQGDLDARLAAASAALSRIERAAAIELGALGLSPRALALADAAALPVPQPDAADRHERRLAELSVAAARHAERDRDARARLQGIRRDRDALERAGSVPSETDLGEARARRDAAWTALRATVGGAEGARATARRAPPDAEALDAYEERVRDADALADRLRREAERVTGLARLLADEDAARGELAALETERASLTCERDAAAMAWQAAWAPSSLEPREPAAARSWLQRHARLAGQAAEVEAARAEVETLRSALERHRSELSAAVAATPGAPGARDATNAEAPAPLVDLLDHAERRLEALDAVRREHEALERAVTRPAPRSAGSSARSTRPAPRSPRGRRRGRPPSRRSASRRRRARRKRPRCSPTSPSCSRWSTRRAGSGIASPGCSRTRRRSRTWWRLSSPRTPRTWSACPRSPLPTSWCAATAARAPTWSRPSTSTASSRTSRARGASSRPAASAPRRAWPSSWPAPDARDLDALRLAEERSVELVAIEQQAPRARRRARRRSAPHRRRGLRPSRADRGIAAGRGLHLGVPSGVGEKPSLVRGARRGGARDGPRRLSAELERLEGAVEDAERRHALAQREIGTAEAGLRQLETKSVNADAAADAEECLARLRGHAERYVRVRLAAAVLAREVERYREAHQGPVLARASEVFRGLTLGSFTGLKAGWDDDERAVLRCVRTSGADVGVDALSDGARDQLYLALRIASIERHGAGAEPMPLIVDDILVHFDDDRARAALAALGELACRTQVLFFTHHRRLVELAREAVPADRLREHRLG